jgi:uncharacterized membrane protein
MFLVFLALIVVGVVLLLRKGGPGTAPQLPAGDDALSTIRIRYAKGDMTREEFLQANTDLGGPPPSA